jgi:23S rRNA (guanosine2251-2'-O)-methyltransferase
MVDSQGRRGRRREVMSNHNRCWIWGRNVVLETVGAGYWPVLELLVGNSIDGKLLDETLRMAERMQIAVAVVTEAELSRACRSTDHQGFAARMMPFPCRSLTDLLRILPANATVAVLDRLQDSFNFGAIVRCASTLGVDGIIIGNREQAEINSQVARSSAGAINHLPISQVDDLVRAVDEFRERGFQVVAASEKAETPVHEADFRGAVVVIIGNEGRGIRPELLSRCDLSVSIPMTGRVGSLNAAVAAGVLFYEIRRQRLTLPQSR